MSCVFVHLVPGAVLLLPDDDLAVVRARGQDVTVHGMGPCHLPHRTLVAERRGKKAEMEGGGERWIQRQCVGGNRWRGIAGKTNGERNSNFC